MCAIFVAKTLRDVSIKKLTYIHWRESVTTCPVSPIYCFHLDTFLNKKNCDVKRMTRSYCDVMKNCGMH